MRILQKLFFLIALIAAVSPWALAQWAATPTRDVPRTPDGKPNLEGPTPRTADGKPDLSGIWGARFGGQRGARGQGAGGPAAADAPGGGAQRGAGAGPPTVPPLPPDGIPIATFGNAGQGFKDDLPFQPWAAELMKKRRADFSKDNPDAHCLPMGFMQFHNHPEPRKMIQLSSMRRTAGCARYTPMDGNCPVKMRSPGGTAIRSAIGKATLSW